MDVYVVDDVIVGPCEEASVEIETSGEKESVIMSQQGVESSGNATQHPFLPEAGNKEVICRSKACSLRARAMKHSIYPIENNSSPKKKNEGNLVETIKDPNNDEPNGSKK